ncbi:cytochrome c maturation protein CcmE [Marivirga harenae]|uniref:cytochrome c maturation protein CcmE domain-containing protein n=1 Tax=Marivirga harenae TaxID=2010992 RepID=UPI0026E09330|nr:cytochrome c maturation protein CcmE [Marivirga harenae]WKV13043.1 cytochrome c maturation protein CcmE [Marivirga harenae]|tara:strand:- start:178804 stop:179205 length:402 start_codon:yes stop_codon:yes gene_type:complete
MKRSYIFGIIVIAAAIMMIVSTAGDASSYVSFKDAHDMALEGNDTKIHVVGELKKSEKGEIIGLNPSDDKLSFTFMMVDENGIEQEVFYNEPMPADFKRSEQVVVIGSFQKGTFIADKILMKCPSKYQEETVI